MSKEVVYIPVYIDKWKALTDALTEQDRNKLIGAYLDYAVFRSEPKGLAKTSKVLFQFMKTTADDLWKDKGGAPTGNQNAKKKTTEKQLVDLSEAQLVESKKNNPYTKAKAETNTKTEVCVPPKSPQGEIGAPTLDEVRKFAEESGLKNINPVRFYKYYKAMGWKRKGEPIEDWRSLMEYWTEPETPPEPDKPYHPVEKLTECPLCHSTNVSSRGKDGLCYLCGKHLTWSTSDGEWLEDKV